MWDSVMCVWVAGYQCLHAWLIEVNVLDAVQGKFGLVGFWYTGWIVKGGAWVGLARGYCRFLESWNKIPKHFSMTSKSQWTLGLCVEYGYGVIIGLSLQKSD